MDGKVFERFIVEQFGGQPNTKQTGDFGMDGFKRVDGEDRPLQVKNKNTAAGRPDMQKFAGYMINAGKKRGYFISHSFAPTAYEYVAELKLANKIEIELVKVEDIIPIAAPPVISIDYESIETDEAEKTIIFTAKGAGIELWQWDFSYEESEGFKTEIFLDKSGRQIKTFPSGRHKIAVRAFKRDGISGIEIISLVINGGVRKE